MHGLDWNLLRSFVFVIQTGSLSAAARALEATQPTIGRHIESLEANLGIPLFVRSREGLSPTDEALNLFPEAQTMVSAYGAFIRRASGEDPAEIGSIRLAVSEIIGAEVLPGLLGEFRQQFPAVHLEFSVSNRVDNLLKREADIAIRMTEPTQDALVVKKIGVTPIGFYAHKNYADRHGLPQTPGELSAHSLIGPEADPDFLRALNELGCELTMEDFDLRSNNQIVQLNLLRAGLGIGVMQTMLARKESALHPVLPGMSLSLPICLVMHEDLKSSRIIRALFNHLAKIQTDQLNPG
jgi:DNA-binding transcriptional LysR family regulator